MGAEAVVSRVVEIVNTRGLHARAAAKLVNTAERFSATVDVLRDGQVVSARSIMGLMMLGAGMGSTIELRAEGFDAHRGRWTRSRAWSRPASMSRTEGGKPTQRTTRASGGPQDGGEHTLAGIPVSPGIAIGPVYAASEPKLVAKRGKIRAGGVEAELGRLEVAVQKSRKQLAKLRARLGVLPEDSQHEIAPLIDAYLQMLGPSRLLRPRPASSIADGLVTAETRGAGRGGRAGGGDAGGGRRARARRWRRPAAAGGGDTRDRPAAACATWRRRRSAASRACPRAPSWWLRRLRPADAALIDPARIAGLATEEGGTDGHTAIMLRALGVPAVLGAHGLLAAARTGTLAVLDGAAGRIVLHPEAATLAAAKGCVAEYARERQRLARFRRLLSETTDHEPVQLQANLELLAELPLVAGAGATGIGLFRTEFLFMNRESLPDEAAQAETYRTVIEAMDGDSVTIRVLDWGGEKDIDALVARGLVPDTLDHNPALGVRGLRLLLRQPDLFETQLAAILRAAKYGPVRCAAADGHHHGRGARGARDLRARRPPPAPARREAGRQAAASGHHDRDAWRRAVRRRAGAGGGFLRHRHQRPGDVHAGGGPRGPPTWRACTTRCTRRCCG